MPRNAEAVVLVEEKLNVPSITVAFALAVTEPALTVMVAPSSTMKAPVLTVRLTSLAVFCNVDPAATVRSPPANVACLLSVTVEAFVPSPVISPPLKAIVCKPFATEKLAVSASVTKPVMVTGSFCVMLKLAVPLISTVLPKTVVPLPIENVPAVRDMAPLTVTPLAFADVVTVIVPVLVKVFSEITPFVSLEVKLPLTIVAPVTVN